MIFKTSFTTTHDANSSPIAKLINYLDKSQGLTDRCGRDMTDEDKQQFIESTKTCDMGRLFTFSPENTDLTDSELSKATRQTMAEYLADKYSTDYLFATHRDTDHPHTQVAIAGNNDDLYMDRDDIDDLQQTALKQFQEEEIELAQLQLNGQELDEDVADKHTQPLTITNMDDNWKAIKREQTELDASRNRGIQR